MIRRVIAAVVLAVVGLVLLGFAWPQLFGLQDAPFFAQVVSLRALAGLCAILGLAVLLLVALIVPRARRFCMAMSALLALFIGISAAVLGTRGFGDTAFEEKQPGDITVLAWNTLGDAPGAEEIARVALETGADVVSLPETTVQTAVAVAEIMRDGGSPMWVHSLAYDLISKARSTSLLTSVELGQYTSDPLARTTSVLPTLVATPLNGDGPTIVAVHAVSPTTPQLQNWRDDLQIIADLCSGGDVIMAGDFNATLDHFSNYGHPDGGDLGACYNGADATGNAAVGTWPTMLPALVGAPIDHVMATANWRATGGRVIQSVDHSGSDHRPIVVQLSRAEGE